MAQRGLQLEEDEGLLKRCDHVVLKKQDGALSLTTKHLTWTTAAQDKFFAMPLAIIKKHEATKAGSAQCLLRVHAVLNGAEQKITFLFEAATAEEDRDGLRELLSETLRFQTSATAAAKNTLNKKRGRDDDDEVQEVTPTPKRTKPAAAAATAPVAVKKEIGATGVKRLLLEQDSELMLLYEQVVGTGIVTDDEFWASRQNMVHDAEKKTTRDKQQKQGLSSQLDTLVKPASQEGDTVKYRLTNAMIHQIFVDYPLVERAYKEFVPAKMSVKDFWTRFLKSQRQNVKRDEAKPVVSVDEAKQINEPTLDEMFDKLTLTPEQERAEMQKQIREMDPTVNLVKAEEAERIGDDDEDDTGSEIMRKEKQRRLKSQQLIKKFNRHGQLLLNSFITVDKEDEVELEKADRLRSVIEQTALHDLEDESVLDSTADSSGPKANFSFHPIVSALTSFYVNIDGAADTATRLREWKPPKSQDELFGVSFTAQSKQKKAQFATAHAKILTELFEDKSIETLDDEGHMAEELRGQINVVEELLRHFWIYMNLPVTLPNEERLQRIMDSLYGHGTNLEQLRANFTGQIADLLDSVLDPIAQAKRVFRSRLRPI